MRKFMCLLLLVCLVMVSGGCATILSGDSQKINISTAKGEKYTIAVDGQKYTVPAIIDIQRQNRDRVITVDECPSEQILLHKEINPVFFVNLLGGGVFGSTTDYASESMWKYQPENVKIDCIRSK